MIGLQGSQVLCVPCHAPPSIGDRFHRVQGMWNRSPFDSERFRRLLCWQLSRLGPLSVRRNRSIRPPLPSKAIFTLRLGAVFGD